MADSISTFLQGLDSDSSKTSNLSKKYRNAKNWRLVTEEGSSTSALENIRGNKLYFSLPTTSPVVSFEVTGADGSGLHGNNDNIIVTVNGTDYTLFVDPASAGETDTNSALRDIYVTRMNAATAFDQSGNSVTNPLLVFNLVAVTSGGNTGLIYSTGTTVTSISISSHVTNVSTIVASQSNLRVIGWTTIRDDFILLTCSEDNPVVGGPGQIWRLSYTPETLGGSYDTTLTLLYNNLLNFTEQHPIPSPGAITGRFENQNIKRIYWTDNLNRIRKFNTADPDGFGTPVDNINLVPATDFSVPIFQDVTSGGALPVGMYQYAYRLSTAGGQQSLFSRLSNMIPVNDVDEEDSNTDTRTYDGVSALTPTSKKNVMQILNLDTDFDTIDVIAVFRVNGIDVPAITIIREEPIPSNGVYEFTHTGSETTTALTLEEFTLLSSAFTHCKSIEQKDNVLFAANVRNQRLNLDYDARAFRFSQLLVGGGGGGDQTQILAGNFTSVPYPVGTNPETLDDINPDQDANRFQTDGNTIGGEGVNISYEIIADGNPLPSTDRNHHYDSQEFGAQTGNVFFTPYRLSDRGGVTRSLGVTDQDYPQKSFFENYMHPAQHGLFKGYMRDEVYRFAIVFYDKDGTPDFAKWIADIKMPESFRGSGLPFPIGTFVSGTFEYYTHPLFVRFTVNIPSSIRGLIGGYSIVRVERGQGDKTILSQGVLGKTIQTGTAVAIQPRVTFDRACEILGLYVQSSSEYVRGFFPDSFFENNITYQSGDRLKVVHRMEEVHTTQHAPVGAGLVTDIGTTKAYNPINPSRLYTADIAFGALIPQGAGSVALNDLSNTFNNRYVDPTSEVVRGQKCFLMRINNVRDVFGTPVTSSDLTPAKGVYLVNYVRDNSAQYGGNTLAQKANNRYIPCGHFQVINDSSPASFTLDLFGGDTFLPVWDFQERLQNNDVDGASTNNITHSHVNYFVPVETTLDIDMRTGVSVNRNTIGGGATYADGTVIAANQFGGDISEEDNIFEHYNLENNVVSFISKPINFDLVEEFDNRVHASEVKINGEASDQWTRFLVANIIDVEGTYGPINNLVKIGDEIVFFQDKGFGSLSINPKVMLTDQTGAALQLGTGTILEDFKYASTEIGSKHQWGMTVTRNSVIFFDIYTKKMYRYTVGGGVKPVSDVKGLQAFFANNLEGTVQTSDNPLIGAGITATYDKRFNEAIFTFKDVLSSVVGIFSFSDSPFSIISGLPETLVDGLSIGDTITTEFTVNGTDESNVIAVLDKPTDTSIKVAVLYWISPITFDSLVNGDEITLVGPFNSAFTIAYSDQVDAFTSFYDFFPSLYINDRRVIITPDSSNEDSLYIHNENDYGDFYGLKFPSTLQLLVNPAPDTTKVFDNLQWHTEATIGGIDQPVTTFNTLRCRNDYQDSGLQVLTNNANLKRKERSWSMAIPRNSDRSRLRDKHLEISLSFTNVSNIRLVMNFLKSFFRSSAR